MLNDSSHRPSYSSARFLLAHAAAADNICPSPELPPPPPRRMDQQQQPSSSGHGTGTGGSGPTTPRRQLQGPRPPRLNVRMESHAIKKPAVSGPQAHQGQTQGRRAEHHNQQQQPAARAPVIIYDASPKVIHAKPSEFMALVQRLTGPGASEAPSSQQQQQRQTDDDGDDMLGQPFLPPELLLSPSAAMSPAARLATIERSVRPMPEPAAAPLDYHDDDGTLAAVLGPTGPGLAPRPPGILSPLPSSLPPAAASGLFSPLPFDASCISWLNELSPILRAAAAAGSSSSSASAYGAAAGGAPSNVASSSSRPPPPAYYSDPFVPSPRNLLATPTVPSPTTCAEFFGSLPDF